jgi:hypothetical protein
MTKRRTKTKGTGVVPFGLRMCVGRKCTRFLGLIFFLIGAVLIMTSYFQVPITGFVIAPEFIGTASFAGLLLEIIGIVLLVIKIKDKEPKPNNKHDLHHNKKDVKV